MNNRAPLTSTWAKSIDDVGAGVVVSPIGSGQRELKDGDIYLTSPGYISPGGSLDPCSDLFYADELPLYTPPSALLLSVIPKSQQTAGVQRVTPRVCTGFREFRGSCQDYEINTSRVSHQQSLLLLWQTDPCIVSRQLPNFIWNDALWRLSVLGLGWIRYVNCKFKTIMYLSFLLY